MLQVTPDFSQCFSRLLSPGKRPSYHCQKWQLRQVYFSLEALALPFSLNHLSLLMLSITWIYLVPQNWLSILFQLLLVPFFLPWLSPLLVFLRLSFHFRKWSRTVALVGIHQSRQGVGYLLLQLGILLRRLIAEFLHHYYLRLPFGLCCYRQLCWHGLIHFKYHLILLTLPLRFHWCFTRGNRRHSGTSSAKFRDSDWSRHGMQSSS